MLNIKNLQFEHYDSMSKTQKNIWKYTSQQSINCFVHFIIRAYFLIFYHYYDLKHLLMSQLWSFYVVFFVSFTHRIWFFTHSLLMFFTKKVASSACFFWSKNHLAVLLIALLLCSRVLCCLVPELWSTLAPLALNNCACYWSFAHKLFL